MRRTYVILAAVGLTGIASAQGQLDRGAEGGVADQRRVRSGSTNYVNERLQVEPENARTRAAKLREQGTVEANNLADDLEARAANTELLVRLIERTDTFGAIALRNATFGLSDAEYMRKIARLRGDDLVLAPEDQEGRVSPIGTERGFSAKKDLFAPILGALIITYVLMMLYHNLFNKLDWKERTVAAFVATVLTCTLIGGYGFADGGSAAFGKAFIIYLVPSIISVAYFLLKGEPLKASSSQRNPKLP